MATVSDIICLFASFFFWAKVFCQPWCMWFLYCISDFFWSLPCFAGLWEEAAELHAGDQGAKAGVEHLCRWEWRSAHQGIKGDLILQPFFTIYLIWLSLWRGFLFPFWPIYNDDITWEAVIHNVEGLTLISLFHCFGIGILQVLEQLSGQTPVFSKGELDVKVCI